MILKSEFLQFKKSVVSMHKLSVLYSFELPYRLKLGSFHSTLTIIDSVGNKRPKCLFRGGLGKSAFDEENLKWASKLMLARWRSQPVRKRLSDCL